MSHSYSDEFNYDYLFKVVIVGDSGVGKSNLLTRFTKDEFNADSATTIGVDFASRSIQVDGKLVKAQLWDTAGNERFQALNSLFYRGAVGALICFDITRADTFRSIQKWLKDVREWSERDVVCMLVGNKSDLSNLRQIQQEDAKNLCASEHMSFIETSALDRSNVEQAFTEVLTDIYRRVSKSMPEGNVGKNNPDHKGAIPIPVEPEPKPKSSCC